MPVSTISTVPANTSCCVVIQKFDVWSMALCRKQPFLFILSVNLLTYNVKLIEHNGGYVFLQHGLYDFACTVYLGHTKEHHEAHIYFQKPGVLFFYCLCSSFM